MKAKNIKELKEKIEATAKAEFDFEQHLFKKYPDLFYTGEDGQLLPQFQRCWNDCPKGWETLVDNLFGSIDQYIKYTTKTEDNPDKKIKAWVYKNIWRKIHSQLDRLFNPYHDYNIQSFNSPSKEQKAKMDKRFSKKVRILTARIRAWFLSEMYVYNKPKQVKVAQYKEKFGTIRVYVDSGDKTIDGMIRFAEYLASKTCQDSGKAGDMCRRGGWYATLSPSEAKKQGYTKAEL
jgi:hypothetical protein